MNPRRPPERGASLVEFAFVFPLFAFLILSIIDASFGLHARNTLGLATADAARTGAIARSSADADVEMLSLISGRLADTSATAIRRVVIYRAADLQADPTANCMAGITEDGCNVYDNADLTSLPTVCTPAKAGGWCPAVRRGDDLLGVWVDAEYDGLSGITPLVFDWDDRAIVLVEPEIVE